MMTASPPVARIAILRLPALLFMCVALLAVLAFVTNGVEGRTITVDDDGGADYGMIQDAINASEDGDTVRVWEGRYEENVVVNKSVDLIGNGSEETTIDVGGSGAVVRITADWVNMSGFDISNGWKGIWLSSSNSCKITNNICENNDFGITLWDSSDCTITNNTCENNDLGIWLSSSNSCKITNNTCSENNGTGISLFESSDCTIEKNTCSANNEYGICLSSCNDCTIENNTCSANNRYDIYLWESSDCTIENNNGRSKVVNDHDDEGFLPGFSAGVALLSLFVFMGGSLREKGKPPEGKEEENGVDKGRQE